MAVPSLQFDLSLCPVWNSRRACCTPSFEEEQKRAFARWIAHWKSKAEHLRNFQMDMESVKVSEAYVKVDRAQRALLDKALGSFTAVLNSYGECFDTLLEYMAGMLCFTCDPFWHEKVLMNSEGVRAEHVLIHDSSNEELWQRCRTLGAAAAEMHTRVADAGLAKQITTRFEDLSMFTTRIGVAEYMAKYGLLAMRGPNEQVLKVAPGSDVLQRSLAAIAGTTAAPPQALYPVRDGQNSGFSCSVFPREPIALRSAGRRVVAAAAVYALAAALMAGHFARAARSL